MSRSDWGVGSEGPTLQSKQIIRGEKYYLPPLTPSLHWLPSTLDHEDVNRVDAVRFLWFDFDGIFYLLEDRVAH